MQPSFFQIHGVQETVGGVFQAEERGAGVTWPRDDRHLLQAELGVDAQGGPAGEQQEAAGARGQVARNVREIIPRTAETTGG